MVSGAPVQGRQGSASNSSMWAVLVLGIITAVFAWVWFGGRGEKNGSETQNTAEHRPETAETVQGTECKNTSQPEELESSVSALTSQAAPGVRETQESSPGDTRTENTPDEANPDTFSEKSRDLYREQELNHTASHAGASKAGEMYGQHHNLSDGSAHQTKEQITQLDVNPLADIVQNRRGDVHQITVPGAEAVQSTQDVLKVSYKEREELVEIRAEVNHSAGVEKHGVQISEDMRPSFTKDEKLVVATEVCCSLGEDLKPSVVPDKVMSISAKTVDDLMQPVHVQDDGLIEMNGSEDHVQKENATASLQEDLTNGNLQNVSVSQLNRSANENIDQELQSSEQSELAGKNQSAAQVNGHISQMNNLTSESFHEEVSVPEKLEDAILTSHVSSTVDKCNVLSHSSNQEEERPDLKESDSGDNGCFVTQYDADSQRTKRVAAVQPIPQSVSLSFKVHYITHSNSQMIAVTGDHEKLGEWENFVPLTSDKDGYWSYTVTLPADANIEWKFVMVENGKIKRWEECNNRHLRTNHEDIAAQQWWGYP